MSTKPEITVAAGVLTRKRKGIRPEVSVLLTQRTNNQHLAGYWEFPGGKVKDGEKLEEAVVRELREELGIRARVKRLFHSTSHEYPERVVHLHFFICDIIAGLPIPHEAEELTWVEIKRLSQFKLPPADEELVRKLESAYYSL